MQKMLYCLRITNNLLSVPKPTGDRPSDLCWDAQLTRRWDYQHYDHFLSSPRHVHWDVENSGLGRGFTLDEIRSFIIRWAQQLIIFQIFSNSSPFSTQLAINCPTYDGAHSSLTSRTVKPLTLSYAHHDKANAA